MHLFQDFVQNTSPCSPESWLLLQDCLTQEEFNKGDLLLREGKVCRGIYFIISGCCKAVFNKDGKDINMAFYFEGDFATNIQSLQADSSSEYQLIACEPLVVIRMDKKKLLAAYAASHEIETFGRKVLMTILAKEEATANGFRRFTARQRYDQLLAQQPEVLQRISLTQIASYLGVSRETLSRFRAGK